LVVVSPALTADQRISYVEAKDNLQRMRATMPLSAEERAAVDDGHAALDALLNRLADVPTPAWPTPHQIGTRPTPTMLPITPVHQGKYPNSNKLSDSTE
jgi:hypothetical protein